MPNQLVRNRLASQINSIFDPSGRPTSRAYYQPLQQPGLTQDEWTERYNAYAQSVTPTPTTTTGDTPYGPFGKLDVSAWYSGGTSTPSTPSSPSGSSGSSSSSSSSPSSRTYRAPSSPQQYTQMHIPAPPLQPIPRASARSHIPKFEKLVPHEFNYNDPANMTPMSDPPPKFERNMEKYDKLMGSEVDA